MLCIVFEAIILQKGELYSWCIRPRSEGNNVGVTVGLEDLGASFHIDNAVRFVVKVLESSIVPVQKL